MAYTEGNATILTGIPLQPTGFENITGTTRGYYIIGHDTFLTNSVTLTNVFQRQVAGPAEDFLLGILSVIFISVLSEIVQTIFLRTRYRTRRSQGLYTAYLIDEYSHFRNIWSHATAHNARAQRVRERSGYPSFHQHRSMFLSFFVLVVAAMIFAADVVAVYITQPRRFFSKELEYNLRGIQPIAVKPGLSKYIRTLSRRRPCISPFFQLEDQKRHYVINSCSIINSVRELDSDVNVSRQITIQSFYHIGGSDHTIRFGSEGSHTIRVRAEIFLDEGGRAVKRILFSEPENYLRDVRYLHNVTIYAVMEWSCNQPFARFNCQEIVDNLVMARSAPITQQIVLWKEREKNVLRNVSGLETVYRIEVNNPFEATSQGLRPLLSSSAIEEVKGSGWYEDQLRRNLSIDIPDLVSEDGRVAGVYLLGLVVLFLSMTLALLRFLFQPVSLASVAFQYLERQTEKLREEADDGKIQLYYDDDDGNGAWSGDESLDGLEKRTGARGPHTIMQLHNTVIWDGEKFIPLDSVGREDDTMHMHDRIMTRSGSSHSATTFDLEYEDVDYSRD